VVDGMGWVLVLQRNNGMGKGMAVYGTINQISPIRVGGGHHGSIFGRTCLHSCHNTTNTEHPEPCMVLGNALITLVVL
jgi:hypothetical protein